MENKVKKNKCICAVAVCSSPKSDSTIYHQFPKDNIRQKKLTIACKRDDHLFNPQTALVCSNHFQPTDYKQGLQNELLGLPIRKRLNKEAVPSLKLNYLQDQEQKPSKLNGSRLKQKLEQRQVINSLLQPSTKLVIYKWHSNSINQLQY